MTCVALLEERLVGFATVTASALERSEIPPDSLGRRLPAVLRLARLGVDVHSRGLGIGSALLRHVLRLAVVQRDSLGCVGVVTDAKAEATRFYLDFGFTPLEGVREGTLHGDPTPMFLPIQTVVAALE